MSFEGPDADSFGGDEDGHRKRDSSRKRDGKKDKKEKGYTMFEEEDSDGDSLVIADDMKSPSKAKGSKAKPFKFPVRKEKTKEKEEKKDKDSKKEEKEKRREEKEGKKMKKEKKKNKLQGPAVTIAVPNDYDNPIFGVPLPVAVARNKSHDGIELPTIVRECVDYIEECGLACEGIYRISGVKSKVQALKDSYNRHQPIYLYEHEPNIVASLLKQFLRDLPEPVLTTALMPKFEDASTAKSNKRKVELFSKLIQDLPVSNRLLLSWMIVHMSHVIDLAKENKMTLQNVSIVLSPTMRISHRVLNVLFSNSQALFGNVLLRKYVPPLRPAHSKWSLELPDNLSSLEEELAKQESLLNQLHTELNSGVTDPVIEEQLWEVQRVVTQLKRKIKLAKKGTEKGEGSQPAVYPKRSSSASLPSLSAPEELKLDLQAVPVQKENTSPPTPTSTVTKPELQPSSKVDEHKESTITLESSKTVKFAPVLETKVEKGEKEDEDEKEQGMGQEEKTAKNVETDEKDKDIEDEDLKEKEEDGKDEKIEEEDEECAKAEEEAVQVKDTEDDKEELPATQEKAESDEDKGDHNVPQVVTTKEAENDSKRDSGTEKLKRRSGDGGSVSFVTDRSAVREEEKVQEKDEEEEEKKDEEEGKPEKRKDTDNRKREEEKTQAGESNPPSSRQSETAIADTKVVAPVPPFMSLTLLEPVKAATPARRKLVGGGAEETEDESMLGEWKDLEDELLGKRKEKSQEETAGVDNEDDDASLDQLLEDEYALVMEEEELTAIADELRQKMATERSEMERLAQEIQELHYLRQDSDLEDMSSDSNSSEESEDEDDLQDLLSQLIQDNQDLETQNAEMCQKIHEERMICLSVKLQIRLLQQKQLEASCG